MCSSNLCGIEKCTGCWACVNACPKKCISMKSGELMHLYPSIDKNLCINCGKCTIVCPEINNVKKLVPQIVYAARTKDEIDYLSSTSGGISSVLANLIIAKGGIVYGCADLGNGEIRHIKVVDKHDLHLLKGSKYVQSPIFGLYCEIKQDLENNKIVLFVGTPCQVAGLKNFLRKEYEFLYTVDVICHGVPSLSYLRLHVKCKTGLSTYGHIKFRNGNDMVLSIEGPDKKICYSSNLWEQRYEDEYYNAFIDGFSYRRSCHSCRYAELNRVSDVTVGDFWGLKSSLPVSVEDGVNCVLVNTNKGFQLLDAIKQKIFCYEQPVTDAVNGNDQLKFPSPDSRRIKLFRILSKLLGISNSYRLLTMDKYIKLKKGQRLH